MTAYFKTRLPKGWSLIIKFGGPWSVGERAGFRSSSLNAKRIDLGFVRIGVWK